MQSPNSRELHTERLQKSWKSRTGSVREIIKLGKFNMKNIENGKLFPLQKPVQNCFASSTLHNSF